MANAMSQTLMSQLAGPRPCCRPAPATARLASRPLAARGQRCTALRVHATATVETPAKAGSTSTEPEVLQAINAIRFLSIDGVNKANSGAARRCEAFWGGMLGSWGRGAGMLKHCAVPQVTLACLWAALPWATCSTMST